MDKEKVIEALRSIADALEKSPDARVSEFRRVTEYVVTPTDDAFGTLVHTPTGHVTVLLRTQNFWPHGKART